MNWDWSHAAESSTERRRRRREKPRTGALLRRGTAYAFALGFLGFGIWFFLTFRIGYVLTSSMSPTLKPGDQYLIHLRAYSHARPRRGDIIVFRDEKDGMLLVKRVVGLPGETISIVRGRVFINDKLIAEPYLAEKPMSEWPLQVTIPGDSVFVLGDNRDESDDSRDFGPVRLDEIMGRAERILRPTDRRRALTGPPDQPVATTS